MLVVSALSEKGLSESLASLRTTFQQQPDLSLADAAFTLATGREDLPFRAAIVSKDVQHFVFNFSPLSIKESSRPSKSRETMFLFPGQGSQYSGMGSGLYRSEPEYRSAIDRCNDLLFPSLGIHLRDLLLSERNDKAAEDHLRSTRLAQPAIFATSYASARLWMSWGVRPTAMLGHSLGELVAACLAGTIRLEDALTAVAARGAMMDALPHGSMLAVHASLNQLTQYLDGSAIDVAAENGPMSVVLSGPTDCQKVLPYRNSKRHTLFIPPWWIAWCLRLKRYLRALHFVRLKRQSFPPSPAHG